MSAQDFFERIKQNPRPVVVDFWAAWCVPCRAIEPVIKQLGSEYAGRVDVWKVNADEQPEVLQALSVYGIPTLVAFHDGVEVARRTGAGSQAILGTLFDAALTGNQTTQAGPAIRDRVLRLTAGAILLVLAYQGRFQGAYLLLAGLGVLAAFTAVYDRCPIYRAVSSRLQEWLSKKSTPPASG